MVVQQNQPVLETDHGSGVVEITLNRPKQLNPFSVEMYLQTAAAISKHSRAPKTRIIVLTGAGSRSFCAGLDVKEIATASGAKKSRNAAKVFMKALMNCTKIVMVACFGSVTGIGVTLTMHCDFIYANDKCTFTTPFPSIGLVPEFASSIMFPKFLGQRLTAALLLKGATVSAREMQDVGFLTVVPGVERDALVQFVVQQAVRWSESMSGAERWEAVLEAKQLLRDPIRNEANLAMDREFEVIAAEFDSGRTSENIKNYMEELEKRKARL